MLCVPHPPRESHPSRSPAVPRIQDAIGVQGTRPDREALALGPLAIGVDVVEAGACHVPASHHGALALECGRDCISEVRLVTDTTERCRGQPGSCNANLSTTIDSRRGGGPV
ncbi:hypothetical protein F751_0220 [Auxenochlorella protothecoides]|uniref:Uncharacterized protein n=1 Tax=Auxenochlorella protothecoides TaxID=3075 RepID=A0A087SE82_AUXPR|nr:hypothetical protein F751_0220 [Auxenochlorella protothecoides]KFM24036.1 hypothetical protein F751_0220 [Auxenochlorella protothecoides]